MKILISSFAFYPSIGGIETMSMLLAEELTTRGHEVTVVTYTRNPVEDEFPFYVLRRPTPARLLSVMRNSDAVFENNISLRTSWAAILLRKPWVVRHATWIRRLDGSLGPQDRLKRLLLRFSTGISNSQSIADDISAITTVVGNPYRDDIFRKGPDITRDRDIVFLGRLVSDKGPQLVLEALRRLATIGMTPNATFIGAGPELNRLQHLARDHGLERQITFVGQKAGPELVQLLNRHRIMVVPSVWNEPFGIVALEGIACGCAVVGSEGGGLKDAIGPCGVTFPNGDVAALTVALERLLRNPSDIDALTSASDEHLRQHTVEYVVDRYLDVIEKAMKARR
jgi:glycogen synthase